MRNVKGSSHSPHCLRSSTIDTITKCLGNQDPREVRDASEEKSRDIFYSSGCGLRIIKRKIARTLMTAEDVPASAAQRLRGC
ncbi:hypothetical protein CEXT_712791 [Caerostris extrusa]|uniref:Uncharacterized protein n=1 Tax=Caerostris extrusa TaxID=172846 RepID=A0AAV4RPA0_CAEEX|nr:hypothetical protein CEXT_712791 [Caerostris extrusa]